MCGRFALFADASPVAIHDRMPVMLPRAAQDVWLDPTSTIATITELAAHGPDLDAWAIGTAVDDPRNDDERVLALPAEN